jgi:hypothetical protein
MTLYAHCYRSGEIKISRRDDEPGMLCLGSGTGTQFRDRVSVYARLAYDNKTLLVPGLPEADSETAASQPLTALLTICSRTAGRP